MCFSYKMTYFPLIIFTYWAIITSSMAFTSKGFLDKFNQNKFKLKFERMESTCNSEIMKQCKMTTYKYNRTTAVANGTFEFNRDFGYDLYVELQAYKFLSNEYRRTSMHYQISFCDAIENNVVGLKSLMACGNYTTVCPLHKNRVYFFCNFQPDESKFPPLIPTGSYMIELKMITSTDDIPFMVFKAYGSVSYPIKYD